VGALRGLSFEIRCGVVIESVITLQIMLRPADSCRGSAMFQNRNYAPSIVERAVAIGFAEAGDAIDVRVGIHQARCLSCYDPVPRRCPAEVGDGSKIRHRSIPRPEASGIGQISSLRDFCIQSAWQAALQAICMQSSMKALRCWVGSFWLNRAVSH
jgi:hypothetical protein